MKEKTVHKLLEGIRRYGLENVSSLSKWIDIPVETARYMIWQELPKHGVSVGITVNLPRIGLGRWILHTIPAQKGNTDVIASFLKEGTGLMYMGRVLPDNTLISIHGIPFGEQYKLREQLEHLRNSNIIESYSLEETEWLRNVSFNPTFYDFKARDWKFKWEEVEKSREPHLTPDIKEELAPIVDFKDVLILKELQQKVPRTLSKLSKTTGLDQHNLRYHYKAHARSAIAGYYLHLIPKDSNKTQSNMIFAYELTNEKNLNEARAAALTIPFTRKVWKSEKNFYWLVSCPGEHTSSTIRYLNEKFTRIPGKLKMYFVDIATEYSGTIPFELFDETRGTWKYEPKTPVQMVKKYGES